MAKHRRRDGRECYFVVSMYIQLLLRIVCVSSLNFTYSSGKYGTYVHNLQCIYSLYDRINHKEERNFHYMHRKLAAENMKQPLWRRFRLNLSTFTRTYIYIHRKERIYTLIYVYVYMHSTAADFIFLIGVGRDCL